MESEIALEKAGILLQNIHGIHTNIDKYLDQFKQLTPDEQTMAFDVLTTYATLPKIFNITPKILSESDQLNKAKESNTKAEIPLITKYATFFSINNVVVTVLTGEPGNEAEAQQIIRDKINFIEDVYEKNGKKPVFDISILNKGFIPIQMEAASTLAAEINNLIAAGKFIMGTSIIDEQFGEPKYGVEVFSRFLMTIDNRKIAANAGTIDTIRKVYGLIFPETMANDKLWEEIVTNIKLIIN